MVRSSRENRRFATAGRTILSVAVLSLVLVCSLGARWNEAFDPVTRAKMMLALIGVTILGIGMIVTLLLTGRFIRRLMEIKPTQPSHIFPSDWPDRPRRKRTSTQSDEGN